MRGFTLLEVMIALAIMAGLVLTLITSFNYHLSITTRDREELTATLLARGKLEELEFAKAEPKTGNFGPDRPDITWKFERSPIEIPGAERATITVSWDTGRRATQLVHYVTAPERKTP